MPCGPRHVAAPVHLHGAVLVRPGRDPPHGVERDAGQGQHAREVLGERLGRRDAVAVGRDGVGPVAAGAKGGVELARRRDAGLGHQEVAPQGPDRVPDRALLVAGVGVAVPARAPVVHPELGEQPGLRHLAADHPAGFGRVVQHERGRHPPDPLEHLAQPVAQALGALRQHRRAVAGVGVRQRDDEGLGVRGPPADHAPEVAEVDLRGARRPDELQVAAAPGRRRAVPPPAGDEAADARVRPGVAALGDRPVVDPPGGAALLARRPEVRLEH